MHNDIDTEERGRLRPAPGAGCRLEPDPLVPAAALLPLAEPGGGYAPLPHVPGRIRPFSATLAIPVPAEAKKHDTTPSSWVVKEPTQRSRDGVVVPDTIDIVKTDT